MSLQTQDRHCVESLTFPILGHCGTPRVSHAVTITERRAAMVMHIHSHTTICTTAMHTSGVTTANRWSWVSRPASFPSERFYQSKQKQVGAFTDYPSSSLQPCRALTYKLCRFLCSVRRRRKEAADADRVGQADDALRRGHKQRRHIAARIYKHDQQHA